MVTSVHADCLQNGGITHPECYCSALASAIKLNLMVLAFAMNFLSTATESCKQKQHIRHCVAREHRPGRWVGSMLAYNILYKGRRAAGLARNILVRFMMAELPC